MIKNYFLEKSVQSKSKNKSLYNYLIFYSKRRPNLFEISSYTFEDYKVHDYSANHSGSTQKQNKDEVYLKYPKLFFLLPKGLSFIQGQSVECCRKGFQNLLEYKEILLVDNMNETRQRINMIITRPVSDFLENTNDREVEVYYMLKLNGHNAQISYLENVGAWIIATNTYSYIIRKKEDLCSMTFKSQVISTILNKIGSCWLDIVENLKNANLLNEFIKEIKGFTLIGDLVGHNSLIKYPKQALLFHSIVDNNDINICNTPKRTYKFFQKYKLLSPPIEKASSHIKNYNNFIDIMNNLYNIISKDFVAKQEEGAVFQIVGKDKYLNESKVITQFKINNNEFKFFNFFSENLNTNLHEYKESKDAKELSKKFLQEIDKTISRNLPLEKKFYIKIVYVIFEYIVTNSVESFNIPDLIEDRLKEISKKSSVSHSLLSSVFFCSREYEKKSDDFMQIPIYTSNSDLCIESGLINMPDGDNNKESEQKNTVQIKNENVNKQLIMLDAVTDKFCSNKAGNINYIFNSSNVKGNEDKININNNYFILNSAADQLSNIINPVNRSGSQVKDPGNSAKKDKGVNNKKDKKKTKLKFADQVKVPILNIDGDTVTDGNNFSRKQLIEFVNIESYKKLNLQNTYSYPFPYNPSCTALTCCLIY